MLVSKSQILTNSDLKITESNVKEINSILTTALCWKHGTAVRLQICKCFRVSGRADEGIFVDIIITNLKEENKVLNIDTMMDQVTFTVH